MKYELKITVDDESNKVMISGEYDPWLTLALLLESVASEANIAAKYKEKTNDEMIRYCQDYLSRLSSEYDTRREYL